MNSKAKINLISISISLLLTFVITSLLILVIGKSPVEVFGKLFTESFSSGYGLGQVLFKATPLIITACGLAFCFHASIFNIGAEGQINAGSFIMALVAAKLSFLPVIISLPLCIIAGFITGGLVGYIPAIIKIKKGVSEVITTIMLNFIILALVNYFLLNLVAVKSTMRTEKLPDEMMFFKFSNWFEFFHGSSLNLAFIFSLIIAVASYFVIYRTKFGYDLRAVGFNQTASNYIGLKPDSIIIKVFFLGAGIAALAGMNFILGYKGFYEYNFTNNLGFTAIAVALLAKNNPLGIILSSILFGMLDYGGLAINELIPKEIMFVVQGLVILCILSVNSIVAKKFEGRFEA
ncbi:ABC transporter permease [soil metagenome]